MATSPLTLSAAEQVGSSRHHPFDAMTIVARSFEVSATLLKKPAE